MEELDFDAEWGHDQPSNVARVIPKDMNPMIWEARAMVMASRDEHSALLLAMWSLVGETLGR